MIIKKIAFYLKYLYLTYISYFCLSSPNPFISFFCNSVGGGVGKKTRSICSVMTHLRFSHVGTVDCLSTISFRFPL